MAATRLRFKEVLKYIAVLAFIPAIAAAGSLVFDEQRHILVSLAVAAHYRR